MAKEKITAQSLKVTSAILGDHIYRIMDFPREAAMEDGPNALSKGVAYRIETDMTRGLFPYRGIIDKGAKWNPYTAKVGIYLKKKPHGEPGYWIRIAYPKDKKEREMYSLDQAKDWKAAALDREHVTDQFLDLHITETKGDAFMPPIRVGDDFLNTLVKLGMRLKGAPFDSYGRRLEAMAIDKSKRIEGVNIKNNSKRALYNNESMSPTKGLTYCDAGEMEIGIILRDRPDSTYPMFPGEPERGLLMFPSGMSFVIDPDKLVEVTDLVNEAISETRAMGNVNGESEDETE